MLEGIISGLVTGSAYAIMAVCVVVLYRLVGVLNLSQAAIGALGTYTTYELTTAGHPLWVGLLVGISIAALIAGIAGWTMSKWFSESSDTTRSVVTVTFLVVILTVGFRLFGNHPRVMPSLVPNQVFEVGGVRITLSTVIAIVLTALIALTVTLILRFTQVGIRLEALAENPRGISLLGINPILLGVGVWVTLGALSTLAMLLLAPTRNPTFSTLALMIVPALAAGLIGALSNVWLAAVGGLLLGALEGAGSRIPLIADYRGALPFVIIILALVWLRRKDTWDEAR